tara:strand:- start:437 stop:646 length:210 start_codon:yes stop_codon:yes gene_type:complete
MNLQVKSIRYFKTNRGVGYQAKTNIKGVEICNNGDGGATYLDGSWVDIKPYYNIDEFELEALVDKHESQ